MQSVMRFGGGQVFQKTNYRRLVEGIERLSENIGEVGWETLWRWCWCGEVDGKWCVEVESWVPFVPTSHSMHMWRVYTFYTRQGRYLTSIVSGAYYKKKYRTVQRKGKSWRSRTSPDSNDHLSTWVEYKNFYDELSLSRLQKGTHAQLKNGVTVLTHLSKDLSTIYFPDLTDPQHW